MSKERENWGSKLGVILAVAGSAVGLGNFLVFPGRVVSNGGGAFLIPYFIAFIFIGIPLAWMEWTLGRMGGVKGHGSGPGVLNSVINKPWAKYVGSLGVVGPLLIFFLYIFLESWILGYLWYSITGELGRQAAAGTTEEFFISYITLKTAIGQIPSAIIFLIITFLINFTIVFFGVRQGIEKSAKILMPILLLMGIILVAKVFTMDGISEGLGYLWNPDFSRLTDIKVWFDATAQIFFTTSVGIGCILTYASYVKSDQDIALSSLTANATNEFIEVIIGGTIVVPLAVLFLGTAGAEESVTGSAFGLGFITMPKLFYAMEATGGSILQIFWFGLLFIGGVTSSVSILQPGISFLEDDMGFKRKKSISILASVTIIFTALILSGMISGTGADDEIDLWAFQLSLLLFGTIIAIIFAWNIGVNRGWKELHKGAEIGIPRFYIPIMRYVTPTLLIALLTAWFFMADSYGYSGLDRILLRHITSDESVTFLFWQTGAKTAIVITRVLLLSLLLSVNTMIYIHFKKKDKAI